MSNETKWTRDLCRVLETQGADTYPMMGGRDRPIGWPDRVIVHPNWGTVFFEMKCAPNWLSPEQWQRCEGLLKKGANVFVLDIKEKQCQVRAVSRVRSESRSLSRWVGFPQLLGQKIV